MDIKIVEEKLSVENLEKIFTISVDGKPVKISKWSRYDVSDESYENGWGIVSLEAYGELTDEERDKLNEFIDQINLIETW